MQVDRASSTSAQEKLRQQENPRGTLSPHGPDDRAKQPQQQSKLGPKEAGQQQEASQIRPLATTETFKLQGSADQHAGWAGQRADKPAPQVYRDGQQYQEPDKAAPMDTAGAKAPATMQATNLQHQRGEKDASDRAGKGDRTFDQSSKDASDATRERADMRREERASSGRETDRRIASSPQLRSADMARDAESGKSKEAGRDEPTDRDKPVAEKLNFFDQSFRQEQVGKISGDQADRQQESDRGQFQARE